ncbi:glycosyltransferase family 9 protein, partial [Klebsiella pneumoniae]|uniref:glycosyltransferase family 9 protein n=2 Tax=Enterobacterales TaxID=91347 RepID=UPI00286D5D08
TLADEGHQIVLSSGPDPREKAMIESILAPCQQAVAGGKIVSVAGELTLPQLAALIDRAKLFIGVDSVPMHMAAALQTPVVAL